MWSINKKNVKARVRVKRDKKILKIPKKIK